MADLILHMPTSGSKPTNTIEWIAFITNIVGEVKGIDWFAANAMTLKQLADAINNDAAFATTITTAINTKLNASSYTAADVLAKLKTVDGNGSGLDADTVKGYTPVNKAGDTMTGLLTLSADPSQALHAVTKQYVDNLVQGLDPKPSVKVATTANLASTYNANVLTASAVGALSVDGITLVAGDRVLVKNQTTAMQNGIYTVTNAGSATVAWVLTRSVEFDGTPAGEVSPGAFFFVEQGTVNAESGWVLTTDGTITIGTTSLNFSQFSGAGQITAGTGLSKNGNTISLATSGVTAGTYPKVTVDAYGRVTAGAILAAADIPALDWSKITTGKPTTLSGYGITDGVNVSEVVTIAAANKILKLDANSKLPASITGDADGNAATASKLAAARNVTIAGDVDGTATFDGSTDVTINVALDNTGVTAGTYAKVTVDAKGRVTAGTTLADTDIPNLDWAKITSGKPTTLAGYGITDAVNVSDVVTTPTASKILKLDVNAKLPASITGNADGNAGTATKLAAARTITLTGDATGSVSFDGSANVSLTVTVADNSHAHSNYVPFATKPFVTPATSGWYRIATSALNIGANSGLFKIEFAGTGVKGRALLVASCHDGSAIGTAINQLGFTSTDLTLGMTLARIVYHTTATGNYAYLEVFNPTNLAITYTVDLIDTTGWALMSAVTVGGVPVGYSTEEVTLDTGLISNEDVTALRQIISKIATGSSPFVVASTTKVANLNVDKIDDTDVNDNDTTVNSLWTAAKIITELAKKLDATEVVTTATANKVLRLDANSKLPTSITGNADGNAATATKLATARTLSITGDMTGSATFDGSANAAITGTLAASGVTAATYTKVTVDAKGRVTVGANLAATDIPALDWTKITTGKPTTLAGYGITDAVPKSGATMTGYITLHADPTAAMHAATKQYVDNVVTGLDVKKSVRMGTTANLAVTASTTTLTSTTLGALTLDGVTPVVGDRVLVKDQTTASQNGIYTVTTVGDAATAFVLTRALDFDGSPSNEISSGAFTFVEEGTTNSNSGWVLTTDGVVTVGTSSLNFSQFSGAGQISAGTGLTKNGNTLALGASGVAAGTYSKVTVDTYGRVTVGANITPADIAAVPTSDVVTVATANKLLKLDASAKLPASITGNADGNAATATKLQTARTITLTGDVTGSVSFDGTANVSITATVADDSHAHSNYVPFSKVSAVLPAAAGWYRIATSPLGIVRCDAEFQIDWSVSGAHGVALLEAGTMYGQDGFVNQLGMSKFSAGLTQARIVYNVTYTGNYAYLEVYSDGSATTVTVDMLNAIGWTLVDPTTAGSIPAGYVAKTLTFRYGMGTTGQLFSDLASGTAPLVVASSTQVTNFNASYVGGRSASTLMQNNTVGDSIDLNTLVTSGSYRLGNTPVNGPAELPCNWSQLLVMHGSGDTITQILAEYVSGRVFTRSGNPTNVGGTGVWTAWKEMMTGSLGSLLTTDKSSIVAAVNELFTDVSNGKSLVASAITDKGVAATGSDTFQALSDKIRQLSGGGVRYAAGSTTATTITVTLGWQPRLVAVRSMTNGGFWLFNGVPAVFANPGAIVSYSPTVRNPPTMDPYPNTIINVLRYYYANNSTTYTENQPTAINATGFSVVLTGNAGGTFEWFAWE